ncbi:MAG: hypothetical protein IKU37_08635 [Candidatus Gastranaerophilales bacterium]|nr:hypothetical protein [Candidatus Gastranaerophilales bacterium]
MKQMEYKSEMTMEILESGTYKGFDYKVVSYGTHPCCYVSIRPEIAIYKVDYDNDKMFQIDCHGGLSYSNFRDFGDGKKWYIGWDYNHVNDYFGIYEHYFFEEFKPNHIKDKRWTTEEMKTECIYVIEQILKEM